MKLFPIMGGPAIPWGVIEPHERQAQRNHSQSLQRLADRGGLSPAEAVAILEDMDWAASRIQALSDAQAKQRLHELTAASEYQRGYSDAELALTQLHERLQALIDEWRQFSVEAFYSERREALDRCATQLAALLTAADPPQNAELESKT